MEAVAVPDIIASSQAILALEDYQLNVNNVAGQIKKSSERIYRSEAKIFAEWLTGQGFIDLSREALIAYHQHLRQYKPNTASRKWAIVKQIVGEHVIRHQLLHNPAQGIKGYKKAESHKHIALTEQEAALLLAQPDRTTKYGLRNYTMLRVLIRMALRRSECASIRVGDIGWQKGHHTLLVHGKGNKERLLKLPPDVWRTIIDYLAAIKAVSCDEEYRNVVWHVGPETPLFWRFRRGDTIVEEGIGDKTVYRMVLQHAAMVGIEKITAHSMRATSITLMLENDVPLWMVQDFAGHADPRTTRIYQKRAGNLDRSAGDALKI